MNISRRWRRVLAFGAQFLLSLLLLRHAYPIFEDGAGPMPSFFYSGHYPTPSEYYGNKWHYDVKFLFPYLVASIIAAVGVSVLAPEIAKRIDRRRSTVFLIAFGMLNALVALSDAVVRTTRLNAGVFLYFSPASLISLLTVFTPLAFFAAVFAEE